MDYGCEPIGLIFYLLDGANSLTRISQEAELTADRGLSGMMQKGPWLMGNFNSDPNKFPKSVGMKASRGMFWTESAVIEALFERYKEPAPAR